MEKVSIKKGTNKVFEGMKNKVVVVTGASSGIGKALAIEAARRGALVVLAARYAEKLEEVAFQIKQFNTQIIWIETDVSLENDCKALIDKTIEKFGRIDVLINNAGISMRALFEHTEIAVIKQLMDINFWGMVYCTKYALPGLLKTKGSVVGVSSIAGYKGLPGRTGYSASKFAMHGFLEALRIENLKKDLHVLIACPGFTASNIRKTALAADGSTQGESPRNETDMMSADEVAIFILDAVAKRKRSLVLTRQGKLTVLLNKIIPGKLDKMVFKHMASEPGSPF
jgi:dehydrogenase/reductase SDR family member 7B